MNHRQCSVIIPAYNEEARITKTLQEVVDYFRRLEYLFEVIVVNDGSSDATTDKAAEAASRCHEIRLLNLPQNVGKGHAIKRGVEEARLAYCLFMDADNSTQIQEWGKFEKYFNEGYKAVTASRHCRGARILVPQPFSRRFLGSGYRLICRWFFGLKTSDINCGFKAYQTSLAKKIYPQVQMNDWTFDTEVFCRLRKEGVSVAEVPVQWIHYDKNSCASPFVTSVRTLKSLIRLRRILLD